MIELFKQEYDINMVFEILQRITGSFYELEKTDLSEQLIGSTINLKFKTRFLNGEFTVESRLIYSLIIYDLFLTAVKVDDSKYIKLVYRLNGERIRKMEERETIITGESYEEKKRLEIQRNIIRIYKESCDIFGTYFKKISPVQREEMLEMFSKVINSNSLRIETIIKENVAGEAVGKKIEKAMVLLDEIFINELCPKLNIGFLEMNNRSFFLMILKDAISLIVMQLILEKSNLIEKNTIIFNDTSWFYYFITLIFKEYKENRINLLKLKKNRELLKYGSDISEIVKIVKEFNSRNVSPKTNKNSFGETPDKILDTENIMKIFFILLGYGMFEKKRYSVYFEESENYIEFFLKTLEERERTANIRVTRQNYTLYSLDFVTELLLSNEKFLQDMLKKLIDILSLIIESEDEEIYEIYRITEKIKDVFQAIPEDIPLFDEFQKIKNNYMISETKQKENFWKEFLYLLYSNQSFLEMKITKLNSNLETLIKCLIRQLECSVKKNYIVTLENNIFFENNFFDTERNLSQQRLNKFMKESGKDIKYYIEEYSDLLRELKEEEKKQGLDVLKEGIERILSEKSRLSISISTGIDIEDNKNAKIKYNILKKIFSTLLIYAKVFIENENGAYSAVQKFGLKEQATYFEILCDTLIMLSEKENRNFKYENFFREKEYLGDFVKDFENFFLIANMENEKINQLNPEILSESHKKIYIFQEALKNAFYLFFLDNTGKEMEIEDDRGYYEEQKIRNGIKNTVKMISQEIDEVFNIF